VSTSVPSSAPSTGHPAAARLPALDGAAWVAILAVAVGVAILVGRASPLAFGVAAAAVLVAVGFAAWRWPLPTLVASALATLADPEITPRILPSGLELGPIGISEPLLLVTGAVIAVEAVRRGTLAAALRDPVLWLVLAFIGLGIVSAVANAVPPLVAFLGLLMTVDAIAIYVAARMVPTDERGIAMAVAAVVTVALVLATFGIAQAMLDPDLFGFASKRGQFGEGDRVSSFIGNPNMLAAAVGIALPFALFGARRLPDGRLRWAARAALFVFAWALLLTFSRGAWGAVVVAGVAGTLLMDWRSLGWLLVATALAFGAATVMPRDLLVPEPAGGSGGGGSSPPSIVDSTGDRLGNLGDRNDTRGRYLRDGVRVIEANPVLGVGPGRYGGGAAMIIETPIYEQYDVELFGYRTVHNFWLHLLGESGALGTAVFLTMVAGLLIRLVREAWRSDGVRFVIVAGAATMLMVASLHSVTEMIFEGNMPVLVVWLVLGLASLLAPVRPIFARPIFGRAT
jgi:O-antigen ligase